MPGVEDLAIVDTVGRDRTTGATVLFLTEFRPWNDNDPEQLQQFVIKLGNYVRFVKNGELVERFPDSRGKPVVIMVGYYEEPTPMVQAMLDQLIAQTAEHGIAMQTVKYDPADRPVVS